VVTAEQLQAVGQGVLRAVSEDIGRLTGDDAGVEEVGEVAVPGYFAETDDDTDAGQVGYLRGEVDAAVAYFFGSRFIAGWGTTDDGTYPGVA